VATPLAEPGHDCHDWLEITHGRVPQSGFMSAAVWSLRTEATTGLMVSAVHTLAEGWIVPGGQPAPAELRDPAEDPGTVRIRHATPGGGAPSEGLSPMFLLWTPAIPAEETGDRMTRITPRHDFFLAVLDSQQLEVYGGLAPIPEPLRHEPPPIHDPAGLTTTEPTYAEARPGELVLVMGYPQGGPTAGLLSASVGRVLDDDEAEAAIAALAAAGDEEGGIPYDPEVELLVEGEARPGMSGGGVFDRDGRLLGILVRASTDLPSTQYIRVVRMTFVVGQLEAHLAEEPPEVADRASPYLEP
jgi:hypothetical protein